MEYLLQYENVSRETGKAYLLKFDAACSKWCSKKHTVLLEDSRTDQPTSYRVIDKRGIFKVVLNGWLYKKIFPNEDEAEHFYLSLFLS